MDFPWIEIIKSVGPWVSVILFFIYRDYRREETLNQRIKSLEEYQKNVLENLVESATKALTQSSECIKWIGRVLEHLVRVCPRIVGRECDKPESLQ